MLRTRNNTLSTRLSIYLLISIAERASKRAHGLSNRDARRIDTEINDVVERSVRRRGEVEQRLRASDGVLAVLEVLVLPNPPGAVDLSVVQVEVGVAGGSEEVTACGLLSAKLREMKWGMALRAYQGRRRPRSGRQCGRR